jgi:outer membrane usher protein
MFMDKYPPPRLLLKVPRLSFIALAISGSFSFNAHSEMWFDPSFFSDDPHSVADLSHFEKGQEVAPGTYRVDIFLNDAFVESRDVNFVTLNPKGEVSACLTTESLERMGVKTSSYSAFNLLKKQACAPLETIIPDSKLTFDVAKLRLDISVPQIAVKNTAQGYVPPEKWEQGINALLLNYVFNGANSSDKSEGSSTDNSYFLGLNSGLNLGGWRLRNSSTWSTSSNSGDKWENVSSYIQHTVIPLNSELTVGDNYTSGELFDSVSFRGVQLASDENMLPDSMRGFAPVVRGIAKSNAQVTVKQNGYVVYQTYVSPGAFEFSDLFSTSSSGDLQVEIKESDGSISSYSIPYSTVPLLQREGAIKYAATIAKFRSGNTQQDEKPFGQATVQWGGPWGVTFYGGMQYAENYSSQLFGTGFNFGDLGAVSIDVTNASSTLIDDSVHHGQSIRFLYAKSLNELGTNLQLLGYRYSTSGYYTLADTMYKHMDGYAFEDGDDEDTPLWSRYYNLYYTKRGKIQVNISQQLGDYGSFYLSGSEQSYWHTDEKDKLIQFGYNTSIKDVTVSLSWNYSQSKGQSESDQIFALNLSLPLGKWLAGKSSGIADRRNSAYATSNTSIDNEGHFNQNTGVSGTLLDAGNLSYSVQQGYVSQNSSASGSAGLDLQSTYGNAQLGYNYSQNGDFQQVNYGLSGGVVVHSHGVTLSQPLGETNVLVAAPGAEGTRLTNSVGVKTDWRGYTVIPHATTYRENRIALDASSLGQNVDVDDAVVSVVPTKGALVLASFSARKGGRALIKTKYQDKPVPFGAIAALDGEEGNTGIVDDSGILYMAGLPAGGDIAIKWGNKPDQHCVLNYQLTEQQLDAPISRITRECK